MWAKALCSASVSLCLLRFRRDQGIPSITCGCSLVTAPRDCGRRTLPVTVARRANTAGRHSHTDAHFPISRVTYKLHTLSVWCTFGLICTHTAVIMTHMICTLARSISFPAHSMFCSHALFFHSLQWLRRDQCWNMRLVPSWNVQDQHRVGSSRHGWDWLHPL